MSQNIKQKLELTWIGKGQEPKLEPRILIENPEYSYGDQKTENILIHGDNLLALKALEQDYAGKVKCIYIDPPYNTGNAFEHYNDGIEHSLWLNLMKPRLDLLRKLLCDEGSIWISVDDNEAHYLKIICDEIFGRANFLASVIWHKKHTRSNDAKYFSDNHDFIIAFCKNKEKFKLNLLPRTEKQNSIYKNIDEDPRGPWASQPIQVKTPSEAYIYEIISPNGNKFWPPKGRSWQFSLERYLELVKDNRIWFGESGDNVPRIKKFLSEVLNGITPLTIWPRDEVGDNQEAKNEAKILTPDNPFGTPKPERLIERIIMLGSKSNDIVLDSFLGSGTTAAVAHKMGRRWIGIELGVHAKTHCYPRLKQVVDGEQGGISKAVNWQGGGGFKFYELAPPLLSEDNFGNMVISPEYNPQMLAAAMAKHEGFKYLPDPEKYWKQGISSEKDFIFTTTQYITRAILDSIAEGLLNDESLLICCTQFEAGIESAYSNINIRKIPSMLLNRCEFKQDSDYSFNIIDSPLDELRPETGERIKAGSATKKKPKHTTEIPDLFSQQPND